MTKNKKYWEVSEAEINKFLKSLDEEKETFRLSLNDILKSETIIKEEVSRKIVGIAGIRKHSVLPILFIVVRSKFQSRGVGKRLMRRLHNIIKGRYSFMVLSVVKENKQAVNLFKKFGYRIFGETKGFYYMVRSSSTTVKGTIISKTLVLFFRIIRPLVS